MSLFSSIKETVMMKSRNKKLEQFYRFCPGGAVLDVGVTPNDFSDSINLFLKTFRGRPENYTGLGIENLEELRKAYPKMEFVEYEGTIFPFPDKHFGCVHSNAVIEHVGNTEDQVHFLNEMMRVSGRVFFTTPNKYFPVESHTNALFIHWLPERWFFAWCRKHNPRWNEYNLKLLSYIELLKILKMSDAKYYNVQCNRVLGITMTFSVTCSNQPQQAS